MSSFPLMICRRLRSQSRGMVSLWILVPFNTMECWIGADSTLPQASATLSVRVYEGMAITEYKLTER